jgi:hypothetical protein
MAPPSSPGNPGSIYTNCETTLAKRFAILALAVKVRQLHSEMSTILLNVSPPGQQTPQGLLAALDQDPCLEQLSG